jgi:ABC-type glycerol-3-phosphate transport system substrate-binding protein
MTATGSGSGFSRRRFTQKAAGLPALLLAACASPLGEGTTPPKESPPAKLAFWVYGGGGPIGDVIFKNTTAEYQKTHPKTTIEYASITSAEIQEKVLVSWTSDVVPDIIMDSWRGFLRFMDSGFFLDVSKDFASRKLKASDFYETALNAYQIDGKQMGMPQGWGTSIFGINTDILANAGVRLQPGQDENWVLDDLVRTLKSVVKYEPDGKQAIPCGADDGTFFHWLWSYGGDFLTPDKTRAATTSPEALAAAEWYAKMHTSERIFMRDKLDKRDGVGFNLGNVAITTGIPNSLPDWGKFSFKVDAFQRPRVPGSKAGNGRVNRMYIDGFLLFKNTKYRDAAVEYLFWLLDEGAVNVEKQGGVNIPSSKKIAETVFLTSPSPFSKKKWLDAAASTKTDPAHPKWQPDLNNIYGKYTAQLRTGEAGPREAMTNMSNDINAVLDEYKRQRGK